MTEMVVAIVLCFYRACHYHYNILYILYCMYKHILYTYMIDDHDPLEG
jgi:hypothetical protein